LIVAGSGGGAVAVTGMNIPHGSRAVNMSRARPLEPAVEPAVLCRDRAWSDS
jgi:cobalamin biosynthesis protein CbiD